MVLPPSPKQPWQQSSASEDASVLRRGGDEEAKALPVLSRGQVRQGRCVGFDVPPPAAEAGFDTRRRNLAWGEKRPSTRQTKQYSNTASSLFDAGHRTFRCGVELFDVTSNFSTSHRTFRRDVELFDVTSNFSMWDIEQAAGGRTFPRAIDLPENLAKTGFTFSSGTQLLSPPP